MELYSGDHFSDSEHDLSASTSSPPSIIGVLFSGGLDSSILVAHLMAMGEMVQPLYVAGGLIWEEVELTAARTLLARLAGPRLAPLVVLDLPMADLYGRHWSTDGRQTPDGTTPDEAVYLPGRNPLLLVKSRLWCQLNGVGRLALGTLKNNPFADATAEFFASFASALDGAMSGSVALERPFACYTKYEVLRLGAGLPLELTLSCLAPREGLHCGRCNKCHERKAVFAGAAVDDPTHYASAIPSSGADTPPARRRRTEPSGRR
ncbi:MAG TPA: 7-cyano-7-deazaguanine synthase [Pirellulales bacterium]|jgi:7-cyano-7-deazaguanine synthase|nr:7-cyano-7-deazaguanine synthase [Pirellulales bacterium]